MLDHILTIIISFGLSCMEVALIIFLAALCGAMLIPGIFWLALIIYSFMRNLYILHKYAVWF